MDEFKAADSFAESQMQNRSLIKPECIDKSRVAVPDYDFFANLTPEVPVGIIADKMIEFRGSIFAHDFEKCDKSQAAVQKFIEILESYEYPANIIPMAFNLISLCSFSKNFDYSLIYYNEFIEFLFDVLYTGKIQQIRFSIIQILINLLYLNHQIASEFFQKIDWELFSKLPDAESKDFNESISCFLFALSFHSNIPSPAHFEEILRVYIQIFNTNAFDIKFFISLRCFIKKSKKIIKHNQISLLDVVNRTNTILQPFDQDKSICALQFLSSLTWNNDINYAKFDFIIKSCRNTEHKISVTALIFMMKYFDKFVEGKIQIPKEILEGIKSSDLIESIINNLIQGKFESKIACIHIWRHMIRIGLNGINENMINQDIFDILVSLLPEIKSDTQIYAMQIILDLIHFAQVNELIQNINIEELHENLDSMLDSCEMIPEFNELVQIVQELLHQE